jgi:PQQ-like domain
MRSRSITTRAALVTAAALLASGLAACSSSPPRPPTQAQSVSACRHKPARVSLVQPPRASGPPGTILWSELMNRCQDAPPAQLWNEAPVTNDQASVLLPHGPLVVVQDGVVSGYGLATGGRMWQHTLMAPSLHPEVSELQASSSLVLIGLNADHNRGVTAFIDPFTGQLIGKPGAAPAGAAFLVGSHVVVSSGSTRLQGYNPATGRTLWADTVPDAPQEGGLLTDGTTVYLNSVAPSGENESTFQSKLLRLDAATGRMLALLRLPRRVNVNADTVDGNGYGQGRLLLDVIGGDSGAAGSSYSNTIAIDAATGRTAWVANGLVSAATAGLFSRGPTKGAAEPDGNSFTAVSPATGKNVWTATAQLLGDLGGPGPFLALPGAMVATGHTSTPASGTIVGLSPGPAAKQIWSSPRLPNPQLAGFSQDVAYVITCQPGAGASSGLCADQQLLAIAV